ncbi:unnamed protein product [Porites evermanni]|uniref:Uncharacterized protein n=1 Tax=Porites evermanni TaxID=104178 RepID=A0ABN8LU30_9CNID|nr:unnamed protein product [Porites evermanni]
MEYGNCFTINTSNLFVQRSGHQEGFKVTLFIDAAEYVGPLADSVGAVVSVYLPLTKSNTMGENPIYVAPGSFVSVSLNTPMLSGLLNKTGTRRVKEVVKDLESARISFRNCILKLRL